MRPSSVVRRRLIVAAVVVGGLAAVGALALVLLFPRIGRWVIETRVLPRLERQYGVEIEVDAIRVGFHEVALEGITVRDRAQRLPAGGDALPPLVRVAVARAAFDPWSALGGDVQLGAVRVERPQITMARADDGTDNFGALLDRARRPRGRAGKGGRRGPDRIRVEGGYLSFQDRRHGVGLTVDRLEGEVVRGGPLAITIERARATSDFGPQASVDRLIVAAHLADLEGTAMVSVEGGAAAVWRDLSLTGISGRIGASGEPGRAQIRLTGGYGGVEGELWHAEGWLDPRGQAADLHLRADRFTLDRLASILEGTPIQEPAQTSIETALDLEVRGDAISFRGALGVAGLTLYHPWLAEEPVRDLAFRGEINGRLARRTRVVEIRSLDFTFRDVAARFEGRAALPGGELENDLVRRKPRFTAHLVVPPVACQRVLDALPTELTPHLSGLRLSGRFATDLRVDIDWSNLDALVLDGSVGLAACRALELPPAITRLREEFDHQVEIEKDSWLAFTVGPSNPDFVPLVDVSPYVIKSFMTTEDSGFYHHRGYITREFRSALVRNLKEGYFKYGASSITMQLVKNVALYREKTLARKLQELILTHYLETALDKDRILEIYVNAIEFGPGIYGIGPAARHYFGKHPRDLNPVEAAFFSSILPNPKERHLQYCAGQLSRTGDGKVQRILKVMRERDRLTEDEYQMALVTPLLFDRTDASSPEECTAMTRRILRNARPTTPPRRRTAPADRE